MINSSLNPYILPVIGCLLVLLFSNGIILFVKHKILPLQVEHSTDISNIQLLLSCSIAVVLLSFISRKYRLIRTQGLSKAWIRTFGIVFLVLFLSRRDFKQLQLIAGLSSTISTISSPVFQNFSRHYFSICGAILGLLLAIRNGDWVYSAISKISHLNTVQSTLYNIYENFFIPFCRRFIPSDSIVNDVVNPYFICFLIGCLLDLCVRLLLGRVTRKEKTN